MYKGSVSKCTSTYQTLVQVAENVKIRDPKNFRDILVFEPTSYLKCFVAT